MEKKQVNILVLGGLLLLSLFLQKDYLKDDPNYIHSWTQADMYSLALRYTENGLNFFKPETWVLNKNQEGPMNHLIPSDNSITAVNFPIHSWIPAVFMKISGQDSPWIFRLYIMLYGVFGLFFLYRMAYLVTANRQGSLLITILAATSPVYAFYQSGFLPSIPSLSNSIIGLYLYLLHLRSNKTRDFSLAILFLSLATLSRSTFIIPLLAVLGYEFLLTILNRELQWKKLIAPAISFTAMGAFYLHNVHLREEYGTLFLNKLLPAGNLYEFFEIIGLALNNWAFQYFTKLHYLVMGIIMAAGALYLKKKKEPLFSLPHKTAGSAGNQLLHLSLIIFAGYTAFLIAMARQFVNHDYYFLDSFFLPALLFVIWGFSHIPGSLIKKHKATSIIIIIIIAIPLMLNARKWQDKRRVTGSWDRGMATINNFKGSADILDSLNTSKNARVLVVDSWAPNIAFNYLRRKGYWLEDNSSKDILELALSWNPNLVIFQNQYFLSETYKVYPGIVSRLEKIYDNHRIMICRPVDSISQSLEEFLGVNMNSPVYSYFTDSTQILDKEFGPTLRIKEKELNGAAGIAELSASILIEKQGDCVLVISINDKENNHYYKAYNIMKQLDKTGEWEELMLQFQAPLPSGPEQELSIYFWNRGAARLYLDDIELNIY